MTKPPNNRRIPLALGGLLGGIAIVVGLLGVLPALQRRSALASETAAEVSSAPRILVTKPTAAPATVRVALPARLDALQYTDLYAQIGGYLGPVLVDVGDAVTVGQKLVDIQTPVLDREIEQVAANAEVARAKVQLAQARLDFSTANLKRLRSVADPRAVSQQAIEEAESIMKSDAATLAGAKADVDAVVASGARLAAQKSLASIVAPFEGEVTQRSFDTGALVVADKTDGARPIVAITNRSQIRAFVDVPQSLAARVKVGQAVEIVVREIPDRVFTAQVTRAAPQLDPATRTRLVEARIENRDHALLPGMFADATFQVERGAATQLVPGEALLIREGKTVIALVDAQSTIHYQPVRLGQDNGALVEVLDPIPPEVSIAVNVSKQPAPGSKVAPVERKSS